jgi:3-hydroxyacyl-CoA dehydrogenase/enoyl-CoA hydratase/3-hydroxybutyryl-CoA epimerase
MPTDPMPVAEVPDSPGVFTLTLEPNQGPMVVLDHPFLQRLEATIGSVPKTAIGLIIRSGSERVFVAGADLKSIHTWGDEQLERYLAYGSKVFGMIAEFPFPSAAVISGAALGGGLELAMHCDALFGAPSPSGKAYPVGLPEAGLSLCPGWGGTNLLPARIEPADAIMRTATGKNMTYDEAVTARLFDGVVPDASGLVQAAARWIAQRRSEGGLKRDGAPSKWIGRPQRKAACLAALVSARDTAPATESAAAVLRAVEVGLESGWTNAVEVERRELVRLRHTEPARAALRAFFEKSAKK